MKSPKVFLASMAALFLLLKLILVRATIPADQTIFQLDFGFGEYIQSLHASGQLAFCRKAFCTYATRMPLIPWLYHLLGYLTLSSVLVAVIKSVALSLITAFAFKHLLGYQRALHSKAWVTWCWMLPLVVFSPAVIKHAAAITYEEGLLIELGLLWSYAFLLCARMLALKSEHAKPGPSVLMVLLSAVIYMTKSSMLPLLVVSLLLGLIVVIRRKHGVTLLAMVCAMSLPLGWGLRNEHVTGRFSIMTSWDGENMYRGASDLGYRLYPDVILDRMFDASEFHMRDGQVVTHEQLPTIGAFKDEWVWNDHYRNLAMDWVKQHPEDALRYTWQKVCNFFVRVEKTPYQYKSDGSEISQRFSVQNLLTTAWLLVGRMLELAMLVLSCLLLMRRKVGSVYLVLGVGVVNAAYASPYILGFNYERHITPYLVIVACCVSLLWAQWREQGPETVNDGHNRA